MEAFMLFPIVSKQTVEPLMLLDCRFLRNMI